MPSSNVKLINGYEFCKVGDVLICKQNDLKKEKGNLPKRAEP